FFESARGGRHIKSRSDFIRSVIWVGYYPCGKGCMLRIILFTLFLLSLPNNLACGYTDVYIEKWPCVIMSAGTCEYVMDEPGGQIRRVEKGRSRPYHAFS
ncbi:MAG: hypothetical protein KAU38_12480, partial [Desulfobacterales bacterium]|nr:hypothetical protein [Desulfobacterales bacterium]